jgi:hypothetical protein
LYYLITVGCIFALVGYTLLISTLWSLGHSVPTVPCEGKVVLVKVKEYDHWTYGNIPLGYGGGIHKITCGGKLWAMY